VELLEALRAWRRRRAAEDAVPAFLVAHDRTLDDIARRRPTDRIALRACPGIGPAKLARYGDELLALVAAPTATQDGTPTLGTSRPGRDRGRRAGRAHARGGAP